MLRYDLKPYERAFTFRVLSQDKTIKDAIASVGGSFVTSNGWTISTKRSPEIKVVSKRIYLRGSNKANDMRIDRTWNIPSNFKLHQYLHQINQALAETISFAQSYKDTYDSFHTYPNGILSNFHRVNWTSEVQPSICECKTQPVHINADGWGNNKLKSLPTWKSS